MDLPAEHQLRCPFALLELERPKNDRTGMAVDTDVEQLTCPDRRCCVWLDLRSWFGVGAPELPIDEFRLAFTDIAHGGSGLYEKLVVLGNRALETFSEVYVYEQFDPTGIPADLLAGKTLPEEIVRLVWARKRVERLLTSHSLCSFSKSYLSAAQSLPTEISRVKYVKACIGYSVQLPTLEAQKLFEWMPHLVEHIYWAQRLRIEEHDEDNETLEDIQEYFGYPYSRLIPRIRESLTCTSPYANSVSPTGKNIIEFYALDYFRSLAAETNIPEDRRGSWITDETEYFMNSSVFALFAGCWLNLGPYLAVQQNHFKLPDAPEYQKMFECLLAACYVLSSEEKSRVWMTALIHRLRQIQLTIQLRHLDIITGGPTAELENFQNVDIHRWSSLSHKLQHRQLNWTLSSLDDISVAGLEDPSYLPPSIFRKAEKKGQVPLSEVDKEQPSSQPTFIDELQKMCLPCLRPRRVAYPITLINETNPKGDTLELIPIQPLSHSEHLRKTNQKQFSSPNNNSFWHEFEQDGETRHNEQPNPFQSVRLPQNAPYYQESDYKNPSNTPKDTQHYRMPRTDKQMIFRRTKRPGILAPGFCRNARHSQQPGSCGRGDGCPKDCWPNIKRDKDGVELWRPPGAIFMRSRRMHPELNLYTSDLKETSSICQQEQQQPIIFEQPQVETLSLPCTTISDSSSVDSKDDHLRLNISYKVPNKNKLSNQQPIDVTFYHNDKDAKLKINPALKATLEMTPNERADYSNSGFIQGRDLRATLYPNPDDTESKPVQIDFVSEGPSGSPRVYISGPQDIKTKGNLKTEKKLTTAKEKQALSNKKKEITLSNKTTSSSNVTDSSIFSNSSCSDTTDTTDTNQSSSSTSSCSSRLSDTSSTSSSETSRDTDTTWNSTTETENTSMLTSKSSSLATTVTQTDTPVSSKSLKSTSNKTVSSISSIQPYTGPESSIIEALPHRYIPQPPIIHLPNEANVATPRTTRLHQNKEPQIIRVCNARQTSKPYTVQYAHIKEKPNPLPATQYMQQSYTLKTLPLIISKQQALKNNYGLQGVRRNDYLLQGEQRSPLSFPIRQDPSGKAGAKNTRYQPPKAAHESYEYCISPTEQYNNFCPPERNVSSKAIPKTYRVSLPRSGSMNNQFRLDKPGTQSQESRVLYSAVGPEYEVMKVKRVHPSFCDMTFNRGRSISPGINRADQNMGLNQASMPVKFNFKRNKSYSPRKF